MKVLYTVDCRPNLKKVNWNSWDRFESNVYDYTKSLDVDYEYFRGNPCCEPYITITSDNKDIMVELEKNIISYSKKYKNLLVDIT